MIKKEIIFFDGDGTLWYPSETKRTKAPFWIYGLNESLEQYYKRLALDSDTLGVISNIKRNNIKVILLSTHPQPKGEAIKILEHKVQHLGLSGMFDEIHATDETRTSKGEYITKILKKYKIPKSRALMIGDNYRWDYKPAKDVGVDALLIESEYLKNDRQGKRIKKTIKSLTDVFKYI